MKIHINEPWWSAGQKFGWGKEIPGIGFKRKIIDILFDAFPHDNIEVVIGKDKQVYEISPTRIKNLVEKWGSQYFVRNNTVLYVIPQNELVKKV